MSNDYTRIEKAIRFIVDHRLDQPDLDQVAAEVGLSPSHFQRLFVRWAGVSPKKFLGALTLAHAQDLLKAGESVLGASLDVGLSSPSRLHDLFISLDAMTPGEFKNGGEALSITVAPVPTPFGDAVEMRTDRGLCGFEFVEPGLAPMDLARARWPNASLCSVAPDTTLVDQLFGSGRENPVRLHVKATPFQFKVWQALIQIPPGTASTYKRVAAHMGSPKSARAVGGAVGANPVGVIIPCHRVIRETGLVDGYRWGSARKHALLAWETVHSA
ncbi:methylated-DNA--[protein]-cysteine S-methyltransferase [Magnetovibrio sp. PR-2]|uniref:bifunctional transcriptional activator/DNA repair enzyme AdaA n=1 Tax=Magnetovibrio sp. PR-2 TaxID=3120356 RepID=UPI002FCE4985